jgi:ribonuclease BN (tRNA processing enzyme)
MEVTLLGTGAPLVPDRVTLGIRVTAPGCQPLLIDTCGGMEVARQLAAIGVPPGEVGNTIVTHRHQDHAGGVAALMLALCPMALYAGEDAQAAIQAQVEGYWPEWEHRPVATHTVADGQSRDIGGFEVTFVAVEHRVPTLAVRLRQGGRTLCYSADSLPCQALVDCARDADLFLCDAIAAGAQGEAVVARARAIMHPLAGEAADMATRAGAGELALVHTSRFADLARVVEEAEGRFSGRVTLPADLQRYEL